VSASAGDHPGDKGERICEQVGKMRQGRDSIKVSPDSVSLVAGQGMSFADPWVNQGRIGSDQRFIPRIRNLCETAVLQEIEPIVRMLFHRTFPHPTCCFQPVEKYADKHELPLSTGPTSYFHKT
jgi:hypothetical protein